MSLITKMLNDLDKRDARVAERPIFVDVRQPVYGRRNSRQGLVVGAVIALVVIGAGAWFWSNSRKPATAVPSVVPPQLAAANVVSAAAPMPAPAAPAAPAPMAQPASPPAAVQVAAPVPAPVAAKPEPVVATSEPVVAKAEPMVKSAPVAPKAEPIASKPEPAKTAPVAPKAEPVAAKPEPAAKPVPASPKPAPVVAKPEPVLAKAEPVAKPAPAASKPAAVVAKAEPEVKPVPAPASVAAKAEPVAKPVAVAKAAPPAAPAASIQSFKQVNTQQRSENLYREAILLVRQGQVLVAHDRLRQALEAYSANQGARQMLAGLLMDSGRYQEAELLLQAGLKLGPANPDLPMQLARAQVAGGKNTEALATLEQGLPTAGDAADYHAFYAALLQKQGRHDQAVSHYITALRSDPMQPNWLIGAGISLRATNRLNDAAEAFQRAISSGELTPQVAEFASQQLSQIGPRR